MKGFIQLFKAGKWSESQHPRAADGKFSSGGGSSSGGGTDLFRAPKLPGSRGLAQANATARKVAMEIESITKDMPPPPPRPKSVIQGGAGKKISTAEDLIQSAKDSLPHYDRMLSDLSKALGAERMGDYGKAVDSFKRNPDGATIIEGPMKKLDRVKNKERDYLNSNDGESPAAHVGDVLRCTVAVSKLSDMPKIFESLKSGGMSFAREPKIRIEKGTDVGYRDCLLNVRLKTGHVVEVQINTKSMLAAKSQMHDEYEVQQGLMRKPTLTASEVARLNKAVATQTRAYNNAQRALQE